MSVHRLASPILPSSLFYKIMGFIGKLHSQANQNQSLYTKSIFFLSLRGVQPLDHLVRRQ